MFQTGPSVPLAEYLNPRPPVEGFNPSDRVEARVVRLYYYRDAHRVAQLINRTVKSYNAASVDIRRRAADRSRDDADKSADERKRLEAVAVRAAQDSRAAEADLNNLQNGTSVGRTQAASARLDQTRLEQELEQANRELDRARLLAPAQANTDPVLTIQSARVASLQSQSKALDDQIKTLAGQPGQQEVQTKKDAIDLQLLQERQTLARVQVESQARAGTGTEAAQQRVTFLQGEIQKRRDIARTGEAVEQNNSARIAAAQQNLAAKREAEARTLEAWQVKELEERRLRENQFRKEVAAARADPDTYGPADPESVDPVLRTSISVIGEGLIQIRGPIKGLNTIRTMVNQIDAPVGQVRISVHTLQVNGERGDRMEKVVANIQRHLDHSRFLTAQSSQMLRYAISAVAARKALEAEAQLPPGSSQWHRDQKYLYAFFGRDFIEELIQLDSEFLKTGNKLLSLNSMNSTSLSAGLFLLALAKNDVRAEILTEFTSLMQGKLPEAEWVFYQEGISDPKCCDACKERKMYMLANNSRFQSFLGFFNAEIAGPDTLNPLQREFLKLAQIFKAQLITELQLKQRVMERSLLEDRVGAHYLQDLQEAFNFEKMAKAELPKLQDQLNAALAGTDLALKALQALLEEIVGKLDIVDDVLSNLQQGTTREYGGKKYVAPKLSDDQKKKEFDDPVLRETLRDAASFLEEFYYPEEMYKVYVRVAKLIKLATASPEEKQTTGTPDDEKDRCAYRLTVDEYIELKNGMRVLFNLIRAQATGVRGDLNVIQNQLQGERADPVKAILGYRALRDKVINVMLRRKGQDTFRIRERAVAAFGEANQVFENLAGTTGKYEAAIKKAQNARRPLDQKKLLDMLIDEMEDKYIELLEGTRAHTANIDNYIKSVATALDDDFNTQFYLPELPRGPRGQPGLGRDPRPDRDDHHPDQQPDRSPRSTRRPRWSSTCRSARSSITEGFKAAKALIDEYGALVNDPTFLSLAKMSSGKPASIAERGRAAGCRPVRERAARPAQLRPTRRSSAQAGPGKPKEFGSALEALIPDPAIYKFETGTGFEIRPVDPARTARRSCSTSTTCTRPTSASRCGPTKSTSAGSSGTSSTPTCSSATTSCGRSARTWWRSRRRAPARGCRCSRTSPASACCSGRCRAPSRRCSRT